MRLFETEFKFTMGLTTAYGVIAFNFELFSCSISICVEALLRLRPPPILIIGL